MEELFFPDLCKMATFDSIPLEVQEQIFLNLTPRDLKECSTVCTKWYDIINSNQIWLKMCAIEGLTGKKFLDDEFSLIQNPTKQFLNEVTFAPLCHWKSHFKRYKYVKRNWRTGYYVTSPIRFTPIHMNEQFVVQHLGSEIVFWDVCGSLNKFSSVPLAIPNVNMDTILWKGDFIVYTQQRLIACLKRVEKTCKEVLQIQLEAGCCSQVKNNCAKQKLTVRLSEKFLLVQDHLNPCMLSFYDCHKGKLIRKADLHKALGNQSLYCSCLDVIDDKVFLAYRMSANSFIARYNFTLDTWDTPISIPTEATDIYLSKKYVCVKLSPESRDTPVSFFQIWEHTSTMHPLEEVLDFYASKHLPIVLTDNDLVIYHSHDEVKIHNFNEPIRPHILKVSRSVMKFAPIWDKYIVILDEKGVSVWDWKTGKRINTAFRDHCCTTFYVSETNILVRRDDEKFYVISYW